MLSRQSYKVQAQLPDQKIWFRAVGNGYVEEGGLEVYVRLIGEDVGV